MSLDDLNKDLYSAHSDAIAGHVHEQSQYDPTNATGLAASPFDQEEQWRQVQKGMTPKTKRRLWIGISIFIVIILVCAGSYGYSWWLKNAFHQDRVAVSFEGPSAVDSTQSVKYIIHYKNDNRVTLKNAEIQLDYAENFQPTDNLNLKYLSPTTSKIFVGDIKPQSEGTVELNGVFYAPKDFPAYIHATLNFTPSNGTGELSMDSQVGISITAAPVVLNISAPQQAVNGDNISYVVDYKNLDVRQMSGVQVRIDFPAGFTLSSAQPAASENNSYWYVGNLDPSQGGKITIQGQLKGAGGESKDLVASLGQVGSDGKFVVFSKQQLSTQMVSPVLSVQQGLEDKTDDIISAGEVLKYVIAYQNTGSVGLRDAIITANVASKLLDFSKLSIPEGGSFDGATNTITWKASDVPGLAVINPNSGGQVHFSVPVKDVIPIASALDKNFVVTSVASIDSPDIPTPIDSNKIIGSNQLELKLASKVLFNTSGYYTDSNLKNTGPIPLLTGQETTFAIHWSISNVSNDITGGKVISSLPSGVRWTGQIYPANENITYNSRTNQVIWDTGTVSAGAGVINPARSIEFQVGVSPQINQIGQSVLLVNKSTFTASDTFVSRDISLDNPPKDTQLYEDPSVGAVNGKVVR